MPKHKNKAVSPNPDSQPPLINRYLFPVTIGLLLLAVAGIGWLLLAAGNSRSNSQPKVVTDHRILSLVRDWTNRQRDVDPVTSTSGVHSIEW